MSSFRPARLGAAACLLFSLVPPAHAGYFRVAHEGGAWWLVDGAGKPFLSKGLDVVSMGETPAKFKASNPGYCALCRYPSAEAWAQATGKRMAAWGFNTVGGHSGKEAERLVPGPFAVALTLGIWMGVPWADPASKEAKAKYAELAGEAVA